MLHANNMSLSHFTIDQLLERMAEDLYTSINYDKVVQSTYSGRLGLEVNRNSYVYRFIDDLAVFLKGKTKEEIAIILRNFYEMFPL